MRAASCCSERSSKREGLASSNVDVSAGRYSMMGGYVWCDGRRRESERVQTLHDVNVNVISVTE